MTLINTDGMAIIGPGSEWFWTAVSGIVLAITFVGIYYQLRMARSAAAIEQLDAVLRETNSEVVQRWALEAMLAVRAGADWADIPGAAAAGLGDVWEKIAILARAGHIDVRLLFDWSPHAPQRMWVALEPSTLKGRARSGDPNEFCNLEWLAGEMARRDRRRGVPPITLNEVNGNLDRFIRDTEDRIRVFEALRTVTVATPGADSTVHGAHSHT